MAPWLQGPMALWLYSSEILGMHGTMLLHHCLDSYAILCQDHVYIQPCIGGTDECGIIAIAREELGDMIGLERLFLVHV